MTDPCVPAVLAAGKVARAVWRVRVPFRRVGRAAQGPAPGAGPAKTTSIPPSASCEGLVAPDGTRILPGMPGVGATAAAMTRSSSPGAGLTAIAGTAGAAAASYAAGSMLAGASARGSNPGSGGNAAIPIATALQIGANNAAGGPELIATPGRIDVVVANTAVPIPEPGQGLLFCTMVFLAILLRRWRRT